MRNIITYARLFVAFKCHNRWYSLWCNRYPLYKTYLISAWNKVEVKNVNMVITYPKFCQLNYTSHNLTTNVDWTNIILLPPINYPYCCLGDILLQLYDTSKSHSNSKICIDVYSTTCFINHSILILCKLVSVNISIHFPFLLILCQIECIHKCAL